MKLAGVERSINPTHSVLAKGRLAHIFTVGHVMDDVAVGLLKMWAEPYSFVTDISKYL